MTTRKEAEAARREICPNCAGEGFTVEPECCGKPVLIWHEGRDGAPEPYGEDCCGSPNPVQIWCDKCNGTGRLEALARQEKEAESKQ